MEEEITLKTLGERIKELSRQKGITQRQLAELIGCTEAAISHYIKGDRVPRANVLTKMATVLGTTSEYLMQGIPQDTKGEIGYAKKLIARNAEHMTKEEKMEIIRILMED